MKKYITPLLLGLSLLGLSSFTLQKIMTEDDYKVLIQMKNYTGEGAYVVVSLVDENGNYLKTLHIAGDDPDWYSELSSWWDFYEKEDSPNVDAISGETISSGDRSIFRVSIDNEWLNKGYSLRFETAVEDDDYYEKDLEIALTTDGIKTKAKGTGFIRYARLAKAN